MRYVIIFLLVTITGVCQDNERILSEDSLQTFSYDDLSKKFDKKLDKDNTLARVYAVAYLNKGKADKNLKETAVGYSLVSYTYNDLMFRSIYLDSAISISKKIKHKQYPALFYINKGGAYEEKGKFKQALDNYLIAIKWTKKVKNQHLEFVTKHNIGFLKRSLGKYDEAKALFRSCLLYDSAKEIMSAKDSLSYLITLSELVHTFRLNKQIDSAIISNNEGLVSAKNKDIFYLFKLNESILDYYKGNYKKVIKGSDILLEKSLILNEKYFIKTIDLANLYLYRGKSFESLNNQEASIECYKKIDSLLQLSNYMIPETRIIYKSLIDYYNLKGENTQQLFYINKLLKSDSILDNNYKYLNEKLIIDYDTPELLSKKEKLIESLKTNRTNLFTGIVVLISILIICSGFLILFYKRQKIYQERFEQLTTDNEVVLQSANMGKESVVERSDTIEVPKKVIQTILEKLEDFEKKQGFLKSNMSVSTLANITNTNSKYLSKVINKYKGKSFSYYINDLRIEFVVEKLKNDSKYRAYTIKALASESGFNTTEAFSKSFYKKTGIHPSFFIKQLKKIRDR